MNIVILGLGEVGFHLSKILSSEGHDVTVVDVDPIRVKRVGEALDVQTLCGDCSEPRTLDEADVASADLVLAVSNNDRVNLLSGFIAKRMGAKETIVRVKDKSPYANYRAFMRKNLLYDQMLSLEDLAAEEIAKIVRQNQAVSVEDFLEGKVTLRVVPVKEDSPLSGAVLKDIKWPANLNVVAVHQDGKTVIPDGNFSFQVGQEVYLLGKPKAVEDIEGWVGTRKGRTRNVIVFGDSSVAFHTAHSLRTQGVKVRMFIESRESLEAHSKKLDPEMKVLHVGGADAEAFKEEHVGKADAFVGASEVDEKNLLACLVAREQGCQRTIALVSSPTYAEIYNVVGIDRAVSPRLLCSEAIVQRIQSGSLEHLATFDEGAAKVCAANITVGSAIAGKRLVDARFPRGCVVGAIQRVVDEEEQVIIPRGDDILEEKDKLIFFLLASVEQKVHKLLEEKKKKDKEKDAQR